MYLYYYTLIKIISFPDEEEFSKRLSVHRFILRQNHMMLPFYNHHLRLQQCTALFAVAEGLLLLDIGCFVLVFVYYIYVLSSS